MSNLLQPGFVPQFTVVDRLRKARELTGLDQQSFAKEISVSRDTVSNYESEGYTRKRQDITLRMWAMRTGVPFEWLRDGIVPTAKGPGPGVNQNRGSRSAPPGGLEPSQPSDYRLAVLAA